MLDELHSRHTQTHFSSNRPEGRTPNAHTCFPQQIQRGNVEEQVGGDVAERQLRRAAALSSGPQQAAAACGAPTHTHVMRQKEHRNGANSRALLQAAAVS